MADQSLILKSQASLDQAWSNIEPLLLKIVELGDKGFGVNTTADDLAVARICTQIVGWELRQRVLQREQYIRAIVYKGVFDNEYAVRVTTREGHISYFVPKEKIVFSSEDDAQNVEDGEAVMAKLRVIAFRSGDHFIVTLPTTFSDTLIVPFSEVEQ